MSSVTSFIKQVPAASQYFSAASLSATTMYQLTPSASNVVGNYPPGTLTALGVALPDNAVCRDMGKTIFAGITVGVTPPTTYGYFRQVQILVPGPITAAQGFIGGSLGNTFGVIGNSTTPTSVTDYWTVYIPITVAGVSVATPIGSQAVIAGGQM